MLLVVTVALMATSCRDQRQPLPTQQPAPSHTASPVTAGDIRAEINALFPAGPLRTDAQRQFARIVRLLEQAKVREAQDEAVSLSNCIIRHFGAGWLLDPNGNNPPTTREGVVHLICSLLEYVGHPCPFALGSPLEDVGFAVVGREGGEVLAPSRLAGIGIPQDALRQKVLIVVQKMLDPARILEGPLPTTLDQYKFFYDISATPAVQFAMDVTIGICQLEFRELTENEFAPTREVYSRLQLGKAAAGDRTGVTFDHLERVPAPGFDNCDESQLPHQPGAGARGVGPAKILDGWQRLASYGVRLVSLFGPTPLYAVNAPVGGKTKSLSIFGAVDPVFLLDGFEAASGWTSTGL